MSGDEGILRGLHAQSSAEEEELLLCLRNGKKASVAGLETLKEHN